MDEAWLEALRFNRWANLELLDFCAGLAPSQLRLTAAGTYGSVADTWLHLIGSERRYAWRLGGERGRFSQHRRFPGIDALRAQAAESGDELLEAARRSKRRESVIGTLRRGTFRVDKSIVLVQAIHHGNEHRAHIATVLGSHGVRLPDLDAWAYGSAIGKLVDL